MRVRIASFVFGEKHLKMQSDFALPSIVHDVDRLKAAGVDIQFHKHATFKDLIEEECKAAIEAVTYTFMAPPDHIWSKGSLYNLVKLAEHSPYCIAVPHIRVKDTLNNVEFPIEARELGRLAVEHAHDTFTNSFDDRDTTECHHGITARGLDEALIAIKHNLPSVFMVKFNESDLEYFRRVNYVLGHWDRGWLAKLIDEGRLKIVGSSNIAMTVELTDSRARVNDLKPNVFDDAHHEDKSYQRIARMMIYGLNTGG